MSPHDNAAVVRSVYQAFNQRDFDRASESYADELELRNLATGELLHGRHGYVQHARGWAAAFPDSRIEIVRLTADAESAAVEYVLRGTHTGTLVGPHGHIPPTWMQAEIRFVEMLQLHNGRITSSHVSFDTGTLLRQLGLLPNSPLHARDRRAALDLYALEVDAPTQQRNKAVVQRFVDGVLNRRQPAGAAEFCAPNLAWHGGPLGEFRDLVSYQRLLASWFSAFPDLRVEVQELIAEADQVAARITLSGTHAGEFQGIAATAKRITASGISTYRVVNGKIVEEWSQLDLLGIVRQIDEIPAGARVHAEG